MTTSTKRIAFWACPRTVSTALLRSFCQRDDIVGVDEPLYAYYLSNSGKQHPMRDDVLGSQDHAFEDVVSKVLRADCGGKIQFVKHMAHHLFGDEDLSFVNDEGVVNAFLLRHPREMLPSLYSDLGSLERIDIAYGQQLKLYEALIAAGNKAIVVDSTKLLADPRVMLKKLCHKLGLEFQEKMMTWPRGSHPAYGVWAPAWYSKVMDSDGWRPHVPKTGEMPSELTELYDFAMSIYNRMLEYSL